MNGILENIRMALIGLQSNQLRSALTMIGVTIGVAAVIILISLGQGVSNFIRNQILSNGANQVIVIASENEDGEIEDLTMRDAEALSDPLRVTEANYVMPITIDRETVSYNGQNSELTIEGATADYPAIVITDVVAGEFFSKEDVDRYARVAVIGQTTVERFFARENPVGKTIRIANVNFEVVGVLGQEDAGGPGGDPNDTIFIPLTTAQTRLSGQRLVGGDRPITGVLIQARSEDATDLLTQQIRETLRETREVSAANEDFTVISQTDLLDSLSAILGLFTIFLGVIAGISLLVGGIGIMNIMLVTVTERTREIGLRKAVGAKNFDILMQFLTESLVMALTGGALGVLMAWLGVLLVGTFLPDLGTSVQLSSIILASGISVAIGVFFGIYPAQRAAKLNPIDALRYE
jgi:putative ABC transport system permease protein